MKPIQQAQANEITKTYVSNCKKDSMTMDKHAEQIIRLCDLSEIKIDECSFLLGIIFAGRMNFNIKNE